MVNEDTYKNRTLSAYFTDCQWKVAGRKDWQLIFDRFFPPRDSIKGGRVQNYGATVYLRTLRKIQARSDNETNRRIREALRRKFDELYWMPFAQTDRIWYTKFNAKFVKSSGRERRAPSPQILINGPLPFW